MKVNFSDPEACASVGFDLGLEKTFAYHCIRCNYLWFPKDFEPMNRLSDFFELYFVGQNIFELEPPKACARCKSRYWRKFPSRTTDRTVSNLDKDSAGVHMMLSIPRYRALHRKGKLDFAIPNCECQYCKALKVKG